MKEIKDDNKQMERYTMFLDWKNQHCENDYTTQSNLQIQCNPYQTTNGIFHRTRTKNFTICMETQKTPNSQSNLEKEKQSWRNQAPGPQTLLQSYSNQDSMVLAQKQKYRSVAQYRNPRDKPRHIWSPHLFFFLIFIYFLLHWVLIAAHGLSPVVVSGGYSLLQCGSFSLW